MNEGGKKRGEEIKRFFVPDCHKRRIFAQTDVIPEMAEAVLQAKGPKAVLRQRRKGKSADSFASGVFSIKMMKSRYTAAAGMIQYNCIVTIAAGGAYPLNPKEIEI